MTKSTNQANSTLRQRLRASPNFALNFSMDGRCYVAKEVEPYIQYWLTERYRVLHSFFSGRHGETVQTAIERYFRFADVPRTERMRSQLLQAIEQMRSAGILVGSRDDTSRYDERMASDYLTHRPFPQDLTQFIIRNVPVARESRVLDLAGGPGSLALSMAQASADVSLMELSRGFVNAAKQQAQQRGVKLTLIHESCNRLLFQDETYDVVTVSQALHWLDDVLVCRGICRALRAGGSFLVIHSAINVGQDHPLHGMVGDKRKQPFAAEVEAMLKRLTLLFDALGSSESQRDLAQEGQVAAPSALRIVPAGAALFRQPRPFGMGFARAFLSSAHIESAGHTPERFWTDLEARCAQAAPESLVGTQDWAVLHFRRGGPRYCGRLDMIAPVEIDWTEPTVKHLMMPQGRELSNIGA